MSDKPLPGIAFSLPSLAGAAAGIIGTIPMTLFMLAAQRALPNQQQYELPPEALTKEVAERTDVELTKPQLVSTALASHFSYGASMGSLYLGFTKKLPLPPIVKGSLFGLALWAGSYLGWMPAAKLSTAATEEPAQRNAVMIASHIIWGAVTGVVADQIERRIR